MGRSGSLWKISAGSGQKVMESLHIWVVTPAWNSCRSCLTALVALLHNKLGGFNRDGRRSVFLRHIQPLGEALLSQIALIHWVHFNSVLSDSANTPAVRVCMCMRVSASQARTKSGAKWPQAGYVAHTFETQILRWIRKEQKCRLTKPTWSCLPKLAFALRVQPLSDVRAKENVT